MGKLIILTQEVLQEDEGAGVSAGHGFKIQAVKSRSFTFYAGSYTLLIERVSLHMILWSLTTYRGRVTYLDFDMKKRLKGTEDLDQDLVLKALIYLFI